MNTVRKIADFAAKASIGLAAGAGVIEASADVPDDLHTAAAIVLVLANALSVALHAAADPDEE